MQEKGNKVIATLIFILVAGFLLVSGNTYHRIKVEKSIFLNKEYLKIRKEFKETSFWDTPGGYIQDYKGGVQRAVDKRRAFMKKNFPKVKEETYWEVRAVRNTIYGDRDEHNCHEAVVIQFGWEFPPFPWEKGKWKSYKEYPPYSEEK